MAGYRDAVEVMALRNGGEMCICQKISVLGQRESHAPKSCISWLLLNLAYGIRYRLKQLFHLVRQGMADQMAKAEK